MRDAKSYLDRVHRIGPCIKSRLDYLRLDMNESVSGLPPEFVRKIFSGIEPQFLAAYPEYDGLQRKIAADNNLEPQCICLSNGSDAAIKYIFDAYVSRGDKILFCEPTFAMYSVYCKIFNAMPIRFEYGSDLKFPIAGFVNRISRDIRMIILANPNNPTGTVLSEDEMLSIIDKARDNNILAVIDEAYFYFYPETVIGRIKEYDNLIALRTFSKLCGLASLRLGYAAAAPKIINRIAKVRPAFDINGLSAFFASRILDTPEIIQDLIKDTNEGKKYLLQKLSQEGVEYKDSYANFVLIKCAGKIKKVMQKLFNNRILVSGNFKHISLKDYIRVTVGKKVYMQRFWQAFKEAI